ncbi:MAG TPA: CorA family divalent cation transporter [Caulobacteraceae bacterium]|jgi:Mg2+ and Co2+ transporter CorA|nr:CorA family divalent cation transporter [Caulobacteraceae bacterium]
MIPDSAKGAIQPGLIWGFDFLGGEARPVGDVDLASDRPRPDGFRWLHFNLADQRSQRWIAGSAPLPASVRELLVSADVHQRLAVEDGVAGFVLEDVERDFDDGEIRVGVVRFAVGPDLMITARLHPLRSADIVRQRIAAGARVADAAAAAELQLGAMAEVLRRILVDMDATVQQVEDALLKDGRAPDARAFLTLRSLMVRLHRLFSGARAVFHRLEEDEPAPPALAAGVVRAGHRLSALDAELLSIQSQLRLLREELDLQATQRTNQNLYILSILTALMMPATLVTGLFGMNTGGLPWAHAGAGTAVATVLAVSASAGVYVALRLMGFIRR